jgi:hypothetical protein
MAQLRISKHLQELLQGECFIKTSLGMTYVLLKDDIQSIADHVGVPNCKVDVFTYKGVPYMAFYDSKHRYYTLNLFTFKPIKPSENKKMIPNDLYEEYVEAVEYTPPSQSSFSQQ